MIQELLNQTTPIVTQSQLKPNLSQASTLTDSDSSSQAPSDSLTQDMSTLTIKRKRGRQPAIEAADLKKIVECVKSLNTPALLGSQGFNNVKSSISNITFSKAIAETTMREWVQKVLYGHHFYPKKHKKVLFSDNCDYDRLLYSMDSAFLEEANQCEKSNVAGLATFQT